MMILLGAAPLAAQVEQPADGVKPSQQTEKSAVKYDAIDPSQLPGQITEAIYNAYNNCRIDEVYVSNTAFAKYKVKLLTQERKALMVYMDDRGVVVNAYKTY